MEFSIQQENGETRGRFYAKLDDSHEAEITYSQASPTLRICDHTGVPSSYEGQGIALQLVNALVEDARERNLQYIPLCPYVAAQYKRHPEWSDVFVARS